MSITPNYVPRRFKTLNFLLVVNDGEKALNFYNNAFGAEVVEKLIDPDGTLRYAEIKIDDTIVMLREDKSFQGATGVTLHLYTGDVEALCESAISAGAKEITKIHKMFFGDRLGTIEDPFGYRWVLATHMEDVSAAELHNRFNEMFRNTSQQL